jgi:phosphoribosylamine--glycine ligase
MSEMNETTNAARRPRVLVVGSGGREHAIVRALAASPQGPALWCAPGNPGIAQLATCVGLDVSDVDGLVELAQHEQIDLVIVGPEAPLIAGLVDELDLAGIAAVGPTAAAAMIEGSKSFAKDVMARAGVPTAMYATFDEIEPAIAWVREHGAPLVVKADGLAAGKGVVVAHSVPEAEAAVQAMLGDRVFGDAGARIVIEECLVGVEASVMAFVSAGVVRVMPPARDHKRAREGDGGPNTGGMGAYAPAPDVSAALLDSIERDIMQPVVDQLAADGTPFSGVLFAGLMLTAEGPRVIEFNARLGDPETQVVLPLLNDDLLTIMQAVAAGTLADLRPTWSTAAATCVVIAADGYPRAPHTGMPVHTPGSTAPGSWVLHAGTTFDAGGVVVVAGGRVLNVIGTGQDVGSATNAAYALTPEVGFDGAWHRRDIAGGTREPALA